MNNYLSNNIIPLLNITTLLICLLISYKYCSSNIIGYGDAFVFLNPNRNSSYLEFIEHWYMNFGGRLNRIIIWGFFQRLSAWFNITNPLDYPYYLIIGLNHFFLIMASINVSIYLKRFLNLNNINFALILFFYLCSYTLNKYFVGYSFTVGVGFYPLKIYLVTLLMLAFSEHKHNYIYIFSLFFIIIFDDMIATFSYIFIVFNIVYFYYKQKIIKIKLKKYLLISTLIFVIAPLNIFYAPGNQSRFTDNIQNYDLINRIYALMERVIISTYGNYDLMNFNNLRLIHYLFVLSILLATIYYLKQLLTNIKTMNYFENNNIFLKTILLLFIALVGLYGTQIRVLGSNYHAEYSDSNPTFFLITLIVISYLFLVKRFLHKCGWIMNLYTFIFISYFIFYPNVINAKIEYYKKIAISSSIIDTFQQLTKIYDPKINILIDGHPGNMYLVKNTMNHMFGWSTPKDELGKKITNIYVSGYDNPPSNFKRIESNVNIDGIYTNYRNMNEPGFIFSRIYGTKKSYYYYIPNKFCDISVLIYPNTYEYPMHKNQYFFKFSYSIGAEKGPSFYPQLQLYFKNEIISDPNYKIQIFADKRNKLIKFDVYGGTNNRIILTNKMHVECVDLNYYEYYKFNIFWPGKRNNF